MRSRWRGEHDKRRPHRRWGARRSRRFGPLFVPPKAAPLRAMGPRSRSWRPPRRSLRCSKRRVERRPLEPARRLRRNSVAPGVGPAASDERGGVCRPNSSGGRVEGCAPWIRLFRHSGGHIHRQRNGRPPDAGAGANEPAGRAPVLSRASVGLPIPPVAQGARAHRTSRRQRHRASRVELRVRERETAPPRAR